MQSQKPMFQEQAKQPNWQYNFSSMKNKQTIGNTYQTQRKKKNLQSQNT